MSDSKLIIGNWKMNGSIELFDQFLNELNDSRIILALPNTLLGYAYSIRSRICIKLAAQDCSIYKNFGPHTGEVSTEMLKVLGCQYVLLGHSERRATSSFDTTEKIYIKMQHAIETGLIPVLCVNDSFEDQLSPDIIELSMSSDVIVAYEPVSAIGTGKVPSLNEIDKVLFSIKQKFNKPINVLYGGSVNVSNIKQIIHTPNLNGVLIGGASLKINEMKKIIQEVH